MASWKLPLGEMKEIVATIARRAGLDNTNKLWRYVESMPEALQSAWINSFGDVSSPGLSKAREQAAIDRFSHEFPAYPVEEIVSLVRNSAKPSAGADDKYGDVIIKHPKIERDATARNTVYTETGRGRRMVFSIDPGLSYQLPHHILHEGAHYMDKARGAAKNVRSGYVLNEPRFESVDWLPSESFKLPTTAYDVGQALNGVRPESYKRFISTKFAPIRAMGVLDYQHTNPADIKAFMRSPLGDDAHGFEYFLKTNQTGHPEMDVNSVSAEGLAQWLEFLPTYDGLKKLPITKKIIEHIEDDPRRGFDIDFNEFMKE